MLVGEAAVDLRLLQQLDLHVGIVDRLAQLFQERRRLRVGQEPAIEHRFGALGDHVRLVAGVEHRQRQCVAGHRGAPRLLLQHAVGEEPDDRIVQTAQREPLHAAHVHADAAEDLARDRRQARRRRIVQDAGQRLDESARRGARQRLRSVAGWSLDRQLRPQHLLLRDRDHQRRSGEQIGRADAALVPHRLDVEQVGAVLREPGGPLRAADLFIRHGEKDEIVLGQLVALGEEAHRHQHRHPQALHVERPAPVDDAVANLAGQRRERPACRIGGDDVHVVQQHDRLRRRAAAAQARDQRPASPARRPSSRSGCRRDRARWPGTRPPPWSLPGGFWVSIWM